MKQDHTAILHVHSLAQQHQLTGAAKPKHPLFSILRFENFARIPNDARVRLTSDFYQVTLKKDCPCKAKYGQTPYDFDEGLVSFFSPRQIVVLEPGDWIPASGWLLLIHPDFLRGSNTLTKIKSYGFFDYALNEALIVSDEEEKSLDSIFQQIEKEYHLPIDNFSQDVVLSTIELLLTHCNRYYNRQFILRKPTHQTLLTSMDAVLNQFFENSSVESGMLTVAHLAAALNLSPKYLSDCLKQLTGESAQQHIHHKLIEKAKEKLSATELAVGEIAYALGFEYPQSFSKFFKAKTNISPLAFRRSFN